MNMNLCVSFLLAAFFSHAATAELPVYGTTPHLPSPRYQPLLREAQMDAMKVAGIGYMRIDVTARGLVGDDGSYDFERHDTTLRELERRGMTVLPILWGYDQKVNAPPKDMERYRAHIAKLVRHFGYEHWPVVEIWNEENVDYFFSGADPAVYAEVLKNACRAVKEVDPRIKVAFGGTSHVPIDWIRKVFSAGATNSFDIMNIHPYSHPKPPEGTVDVEIEALRMLMSEFGISDRPVWITELGYPTRDTEIMHSEVMVKGVKVIAGEGRALRAVALDSDEAELLEQLLPRGSKAISVTDDMLVRVMERHEADIVFLRQGSEWPIAIRDCLLPYVMRGGIVVQMSGDVPFYYATRDGKRSKDMQNGMFVDETLPFGYRAKWWRDAFWPDLLKMGSYSASRFLVPKSDFPDAQFIPLAAGRTADGRELAGAAAIKYGKGGFVVSTLRRAGSMTPISEETQAKWTARGMAISFAEGIERFFVYNFRAIEDDPYYSEKHFGLTHSNLTPKPAYASFVEFVKRRPAGSVNIDRPWHDGTRRNFFPAWKCPDGKTVEMRWTLDEPRWVPISPVDGKMPRVVNRDGRCQRIVKGDDGVCRILISDSPVYIIRRMP